MRARQDSNLQSKDLKTAEPLRGEGFVSEDLACVISWCDAVNADTKRVAAILLRGLMVGRVLSLPSEMSGASFCDNEVCVPFLIDDLGVRVQMHPLWRGAIAAQSKIQRPSLLVSHAPRTYADHACLNGA